MSDVTQILKSVEAGERQAASELLPLVYDELHRLAADRMKNEPANHTLGATALVHEAYLRLVGDADPGWQGRGHFFAAAAEAMRRILVDGARRKKRVKHGGDRNRVELDDGSLAVQVPDEQILAVDEALDQLDAADEEAARVVKLHYFVGMTMNETAEALGISPRSAYRNWAFARAWLYDRLGDSSKET